VYSSWELVDGADPKLTLEELDSNQELVPTFMSVGCREVVAVHMKVSMKRKLIKNMKIKITINLCDATAV
jgi:hypothetical protein